MPKKENTLLVVSEDGSGVREYHFSHLKMLVIISLIISGFIGLILFINTASSLKTGYNELVNIKEQNRRIEDRLTKMTSSIFKLRENMKKVKESEKKILSSVDHLEDKDNKKDFSFSSENQQTAGIDSLRTEITKLGIFYDSLFRKIGSNNEKIMYLPTYYPVPKNVSVSVQFGPRKDPFTGLVKMHEGSDFAAPAGTNVYSTAEGWVTFAGKLKGFGNCIKISHSNGYETVYSHLQRILVGSGKKVARGKTIGTIGKTGQAIGPHLHYEIRHNGKACNPEKFFFGK